MGETCREDREHHKRKGVIMDILDIAPYAIYPPNAGGRLRINYLNLNAAKFGHNVSVFSQDVLKINEVNTLNSIKRIPITDNYVEYRYINMLSLEINYIIVSLGASKIFTGDILKIFKPKILNELVQKCDVIKVEYPWQFEYVYDIAKGEKPLVLVEADANFKRLKDTIRYPKLLNKLYSIAVKKEHYALEYADMVFTSSEYDKKQLISKFNIESNKIYTIPNGVDTSKFTVSTSTEKNTYKHQIIGDSDKKVILFIGSLYPPNIEGVKLIINKIAPEVLKNYKNILFVIVGSVGNYFKNVNSNNIIITGMVDNILPYFKMADIAINPIIFGSGTNIKLLEYLASGIPTITTPFGARGIDVEPNKHVMIRDIEDFSEGILELLEDEDLQKRLSVNGRKLTEEKYDWKEISKKELKILNRL